MNNGISLSAMFMFVGLGIYNNESKGHRDYSFYTASLGATSLFSVSIASAMNYCQLQKISKKKRKTLASMTESKVNGPGRDIPNEWEPLDLQE